ncbi:hypothetical protein AKJ08_0515 [Vulgatibacter incomptus]|uniref:Uncharacterized protein n=1 Tax=Vulgatibacter incomptus TaxID=1391653 RepID=A0A0K1P9B5_9BACT|nr:hypothetical protein AKJ08_0515 [Vulgatibacter incomptus]
MLDSARGLVLVRLLQGLRQTSRDEEKDCRNCDPRSQFQGVAPHGGG